MERFQYILFDLDGTLTDPAVGITLIPGAPIKTTIILKLLSAKARPISNAV